MTKTEQLMKDVNLVITDSLNKGVTLTDITRESKIQFATLMRIRNNENVTVGTLQSVEEAVDRLLKKQ